MRIFGILQIFRMIIQTKKRLFFLSAKRFTPDHLDMTCEQRRRNCRCKSVHSARYHCPYQVHKELVYFARNVALHRMLGCKCMNLHHVMCTRRRGIYGTSAKDNTIATFVLGSSNTHKPPDAKSQPTRHQYNMHHKVASAIFLRHANVPDPFCVSFDKTSLHFRTPRLPKHQTLANR